MSGVSRISTLLMALAVVATGCSDSPTLTTLTATTEITSEISTLPTSDPATTSTTTASTQPPSPGVEFSAAVPTGEWVRTNPDVGGLIVQTRDLTWDGEAFYVLTRLGFGDQIVWKSTDGLEWVRHSMIGTTGTRDGPWELISVDGRLIAAGSKDGRATVWIDEGTTPWRTVDLGPGGVWSLIHHDGRFVALGRSMWMDIERTRPSTEAHAVIWTSSDGESWEQAAGAELFGAAIYATGLIDGPAGLLTVGFVADEELPFDDRVSGVFISTDGVTWEAHEPDGLDLSQIDSIVGGPTGYVVYGLDSPILASTDGLRWDTFASGPIDRGMVSVGGLAVIEGSLVMSGDVNFVPEGSEFNTSHPRVWFYTGDDEWALLGYPAWFDAPGTVYNMVAGDKTLVVHADTGETGEWALFTFTTGSTEP